MSPRVRPAALVACLALALTAGSAHARPLAADLASHLIGITTGFAGAEDVLFGTTDGAGDVIVVVRGPDRDIAVRRRRQVAGIWVNAKEEVFRGVPSFYKVFSSRPLAGIATPATLAEHQIGLDHLRLDPERGPLREEDLPFRAALVRTQQDARRFARDVGRVDFLGDRLFRATIDFPPDVPIGTYLVEVFLVRNKHIVDGRTTPLVVSKIGLDAAIYDFADRNAPAYGVVAVAAAMMAGWIASFAFRRN